MRERAAPTAGPEVREAGHLFREAAAAGGKQADAGEAGVIAALLVRGPAGAADLNAEILHLQQGHRGTHPFLCWAMKDLLYGRTRDTLLGASDLVNDHVHAVP